MKKLKKVIPIIIAFIIGISTTVGAATVLNSKDITYSSDKTSKTNVKDSLDELYNKVDSTGKCPEGWYCYTEAVALSDKVEIGDYISMTPTSTSYTPPSELTGCMNDSNCKQSTLNPSELDLWRVIKKNNDGTVDVISEYASSKRIYIRGTKGYKNFVGTLNTIAAQYTNEKYVVKTRNIGYSNQIEYCTDYKEDTCPKDTRKKEDFTLVSEVLGSLLATNKNGTKQRYWSSVRHGYSSDGETWTGYAVDDIGGEVDSTCVHCGWMLYRTNILSEAAGESGMRPILTLKSSVEIASGDGKSAETAYKFE